MSLRGFVRGIVKVVLAIVLIVTIPSAIAVGWIEFGCQPQGAAASAENGLAIDDPGYRRALADTYFTFPEWYTVYAYEDFGNFLETRSESEYGYLGQIGGFWQSFCEANRIAGDMPSDFGKFGIYVVGMSFSFEFAIKGLYENTIGLLTEWARGPKPVAEDEFARRTWQDYAAFLYEIPWYRYPFNEVLEDLWNIPLTSGSAIRNIERHLALSIEYGVKFVYAKLIAAGLAATADPAAREIMFVVRGDPAPILAEEADVRLIRQLPEGLVLLEAPRYEEFTQLLLRLAAEDVRIAEIAGNTHILMSVIAPEDAAPVIEGANRLFGLPIDARPGFQRVGYDVDITRMPEIIRAFAAAGIEVEHFYDY